MHADRIIIDKKYVHKINEENVFLCNLRRMLPHTIEKGFFENNVRKALNEDDYGYLKTFYRLSPPVHTAPAGSYPAEAYTIRYLPAIRLLSREAYERMLSEKSALWEKELVASLYVCENDGEKEYFRLKDDITEPHDNYLVLSKKAWDLYISIEERRRLSAILERVPDLPRKEIYFANMFVNTAHMFFFEHPNDHVPGMMLIETIRQFIVACGHLYGHIPMQGTQLILNTLDCQFLSYVNINYPILLKGCAFDYKLNKDGFWQYVTLGMEVMQNGRCMALFTLKGTCISAGLFARIRRNQIAEMKHARFIPHETDQYSLELSPYGDKAPVRADLVNLSLEGISVKVAGDKFPADHDFYEISLLHDSGERISGKYKKIWHTRVNGHVFLGLRNTELGEQDLERLYSLLTHDCMALEERQLL